jgi:cutinase
VLLVAAAASNWNSQGSALMMNAVKESSKDVQAKILGVVLFGYTKNKQTNSGIPGFPKNRVAVYCSKSDGVCKGTLSVTGGHFSYMGDGTYPRAGWGQ